MPCPGLFCGKIRMPEGGLSSCGACPRGFRRNVSTHICEPCSDSPIFYDWLYLGFMVLLALVLHWFFIDMVAMKRYFSRNVLILHGIAFAEIVLAAIFSILSVQPFGLFEIRSCNVRSLADWYTLLHNPAPNFQQPMHCTQEAIYPLYTVVFIFYAYALLIMLIVRPWFCHVYLPRQGKMSIYAAMYFIPILALFHALIGGLLYYAFPYLVLIISVISIATHFAIKLDQSIKSLILSILTSPRNMVILLGHWCLHAYGIIGITQLADLTTHSLLLLLVPLPTFFYIFTTRFSEPHRFSFQ